VHSAILPGYQGEALLFGLFPILEAKEIADLLGCHHNINPVSKRASNYMRHYNIFPFRLFVMTKDSDLALFL
jgi:hypothetical protein